MKGHKTKSKIGIKIPISFIILLFITTTSFASTSLVNKRPINPKFTSQEINNYITSLKDKFIDEELYEIYSNTFPNTLDTTVDYSPSNNDTFVITGDIKAMWLRDSSFQLIPYISFINKDEDLKNMIYNAIKRQVNSLLIDTYANAFNKDNSTASIFANDETYKRDDDDKAVKAMNNNIWERKYELDSSMSALHLHSEYFKESGDTSFIDEDYVIMLFKVIKMVADQSIGVDDENENWTYFFNRTTSESFDTLHQGRGNPGRTCGLIRSSFRGSDDATLLPYNIPENAFLVSVFTEVVEMLEEKIRELSEGKDQREEKFLEYSKSALENTKSNIDPNFVLDLIFISNSLTEMSKDIEDAIFTFGINNKNSDDEIDLDNSYYAYEVDCYGNSYFMDDANYPSLMSLPFFNYLNIDLSDTSKNGNEDIKLLKQHLWNNTKKRIYSEKYNPYYFKSNSNSNDEIEYEGVGSPHTKRNFIWPLGIIMRGLTSDNSNEIIHCIEMLKNSALKTGFIHESFDVNNSDNFSRDWFAWANSFFGHFINQVILKHPNLILKKENLEYKE